LDLNDQSMRKIYINMLNQLGYELSNPNLKISEIRSDHLWYKDVDVMVRDEFNTLADSLIKSLLTEQQRLTNKGNIESAKIINETIGSVRILKGKETKTNRDLRSLYGELKKLIVSLSHRKDFYPNMFKRALNIIYMKIMNTFGKQNAKPLFETKRQAILGEYEFHLRDVAISDSSMVESSLKTRRGILNIKPDLIALAAKSKPISEEIFTSSFHEVEKKLRRKYEKEIEIDNKITIKTLKNAKQQTGVMMVEIAKNNDEKDIIRYFQNEKFEAESNLSANPGFEAIAILFELHAPFHSVEMDPCGHL